MTQKILGNLKRGLIFVISAPAGTGKSTLVEMLMAEFGQALTKSCSSTTRLPRQSEQPDKDYEFLTPSEFEKKVQLGEFLEHAELFGNRYGTSRARVQSIISSGKHAILVIDTQGALQIKQQIDAIFIFISPPSTEEQKSRLMKRASESDATMRERLALAIKEMEMATFYDYQLINDNLAVTYQVLRSILIAEEHKRIKNYERKFD